MQDYVKFLKKYGEYGENNNFDSTLGLILNFNEID
jgi:hypothetical protein